MAVAAGDDQRKGHCDWCMFIYYHDVPILMLCEKVLFCVGLFLKEI